MVSGTCRSLGEPWGHQVKGDQSAMKRQNATRIYFCGVPGVIKLTETGRKMELPGARVAGDEKPLLNGYAAQVCRVDGFGK